MFIPRALLAILVLAAFLPVRAAAQEEESKRAAAVKAGYTKYEYRIPMRDGKRLFTAVYVPKDRGQPYPILLQRTPYSVRPYGADDYPDGLQPFSLFGRGGYIFVYQDVRGRWMSEGQFVHMRPHIADKKPTDIDESTDTYDTIDWLLKHVPGNNGRVGLWGISYPGFYAAAGMIDAHPALKAASPQAPQADWFMGDDWHHNGALLALNMLNFMAIIDRPHPEPTKKPNPPVFTHATPDGYAFCLQLGPLSEVGKRFLKGESAFWDEAIRHSAYDDFWKARNLRPHLKDIKPAIMTVGGWFDAENLFGALEVYKNVQKNSPKTDNLLVMGPWFHGAWVRDDGAKLGDVTFTVKSAEYYREHIELPFFEYHLKGKGEGRHPGAWVFETGANIWRQHDAWPPKNVKPKALFFHPGGKLREDSPPDGPVEGYEEYQSDPSRPVPYEDKITNRKSAEYMTADQRFAGRRPDVLVFTTDVLESDITIGGPIKADLFVSTTGTDSDYVVKVIDVYPDDYPDPMPNPQGVKMGGYQQLVRGDVMPGRFRNSFDKPEAFTPGRPTRVSFTLQDVYHTFRRGHRIMIQVQSSWFPLVDRNPQTFVEIPMAKPSDYRKAMQRIYRTRELPSHVTVLVAPGI
jgi:putative CocE/NonD family hydrolase